MYWLILILGVALWWGAHVFKRVAPEKRAALGDKGRGMAAAAIGVSVLLMIVGYRGTDFVPVWNPPVFFVHVNNLAMLIALYLMSPAPKKGKLLAGMRHPMLAGFKIWAIAHLLVNGDLASVILFGGLLAWAVMNLILINKTEGNWTKPEASGTYAKDAMFLAGSVVLLVVIGFIHMWLGVSPFPG